MHFYRLFGLLVQSELVLPELVADKEGEPDVTVLLDGREPRTLKTGPDRRVFEIGRRQAYLFWKDIGGFTVRDGTCIVVQPLSVAAEGMVRAPLLGLVFSALLYQRDLLVLHASAVRIGRGAVAFIGHKGQGKSTMAAAMHARGHALVSDDVVAVDWRGNGGPHVLPGFPQFKMWPEAVAGVFGEDPELHPEMWPNALKRTRAANDGFETAPVALTSIYLLDRASSLSIESLSPRNAFMECIRYAHMVRHFDGPEGMALLLPQFERLALEVPVRRLRRRTTFDGLKETVLAVERDLHVHAHGNEAKVGMSDLSVSAAIAYEA